MRYPGSPRCKRWVLDVGGLSSAVSQLTHEAPRLGSTAARLKLKGIDGGPHKRWSMWFNSKQRAEPYQPLTWDVWASETGLFSSAGVHTGAAWLSSARLGGGGGKSRKGRTLLVQGGAVGAGTMKKPPVTSRRKAGMTSSPHGPYGLGYTRATMAVTVGSRAAMPSQSQKAVSVQIALCNSSA